MGKKHLLTKKVQKKMFFPTNLLKERDVVNVKAEEKKT